MQCVLQKTVPIYTLYIIQKVGIFAEKNLLKDHYINQLPAGEHPKNLLDMWMYIFPKNDFVAYESSWGDWRAVGYQLIGWEIYLSFATTWRIIPFSKWLITMVIVFVP